MFKVRYSVDGSCDNLRDQFRHIIQTCANVKLLKTIQHEQFNLRDGRYEFFLNVYCNFIGVNRIHAKFIPTIPKKTASIVGFCRDEKNNKIIHLFSTRVLNSMLNEMTGKATIKVEDDTSNDNDEVVVRKMTKYAATVNSNQLCDNNHHSNGAFRMTFNLFNILCKIIVCADLAAFEYNNFLKNGNEKPHKYLFSILTRTANSDVNKKLYQISNSSEISMTLKNTTNRTNDDRPMTPASPETSSGDESDSDN